MERNQDPNPAPQPANQPKPSNEPRPADRDFTQSAQRNEPATQPAQHPATQTATQQNPQPRSAADTKRPADAKHKARYNATAQEDASEIARQADFDVRDSKGQTTPDEKRAEPGRRAAWNGMPPSVDPKVAEAPWRAEVEANHAQVERDAVQRPNERDADFKSRTGKS